MIKTVFLLSEVGYQKINTDHRAALTKARLCQGCESLLETIYHDLRFGTPAPDFFFFKVVMMTEIQRNDVAVTSLFDLHPGVS